MMTPASKRNGKVVRRKNQNNKDMYNFEEYGIIEVHCFGHRSTKLVKDIQLKK